MNSEKLTERYIAFLRGINVGGHHKVPMADLCKALEKMDCKNVITLLNSGNVIFETVTDDIEILEKTISEKLEKIFRFQIPTIIRKSETINELFKEDPFRYVKITKDIRLYVSFLKENNQFELELPWVSSDNSFKIIESRNKIILSVLDLSISKTPKAMEGLAKFYGKNITTRNWKTIERIVQKL